MASQKLQLPNYNRYLLDKMTCTPEIVEYIKNCLATEEESPNYTFHKIVVYNCKDSLEQVCDAFREHYESVMIPVNGYYQKNNSVFYTSNLNLILKIIKFDFVFPFNRKMLDIDVYFNDKSSFDFFGNNVTIDEIVSNVVSNRFSEKFELDLSNFCNDKEFKRKKIHFYTVNLLAQFKILMLRMGKDTKLLNLTNNNLSEPPQDILNFFKKGVLVAINLSYNKIPSISVLVRVSNNIARLWVEGNPLCEDLDVSIYIKRILLKFPRLEELDGIKINQHGIMFPFHRNFLETPDKKTKMVVDKFLSSYFSHYDGNYGTRRKIVKFYDPNATLSLNTTLHGSQKASLSHLAMHTRDILNPNLRNREEVYNKRVLVSSGVISRTLNGFPETIHDPTTFTVDVMKHDTKCLIIVVEGIYKEISVKMYPDKIFQFRRTFVFSVSVVNTNTLYHITNEIYSISFATSEQMKNSFKYPIKNLNSLSLINPDETDVETITKLFSHITNLKASESLLRLKAKNWNIRAALLIFAKDLRDNLMSQDKFIEDDDFSDTSSLMDEID